MSVLMDTVDNSIIHSLPTDESARQVWTYLKKRYERIVDVVHYTSLLELQKLRQNDESILDFFNKFMDIWSKLKSSVPILDDCRDCTCCKKFREHNDKRGLYEFLIRLRPEFEPTRSRLLWFHPQPTLHSALNDLLVEEIRLESMKTKIQCNYCGNFGHTYNRCTMRKNRSGGHS